MRSNCKKQTLKSNSIVKLLYIIIATAFLLISSNSLLAMDGKTPDIKHPIMNPKKYSSSKNCPNCGMMINMWARTRHVFTNSEGEHETCSIRCLSDISEKSGDSPHNIKTALYLDPDKMISANNAIYVVGSSAKGTMTMKSKIAFESKKNADDFISQYGGEIKPFTETVKMAAMEANKTRSKIQANRMKKGKIALPEETATCSNCGMFPAKYPNNRSQITTIEGEHLHYCSTKCLIKGQHNQDQQIKAAWVTVYDEGDFEYAPSLYYVVGSKMMGPMGPEAIPFRKKASAEKLAKAEGGKIVRWNQLTPEMIGGHMKMKSHKMMK